MWHCLAVDSTVATSVYSECSTAHWITSRLTALRIALQRTLLCRTALLMVGTLQLQDERTKIAELVSQRMALKQKLSEELQAL